MSSYSLGGSTWRQVGAYRIVSITLVTVYKSNLLFVTVTSACAKEYLIAATYCCQVEVKARG